MINSKLSRHQKQIQKIGNVTILHLVQIYGRDHFPTEKIKFNVLLGSIPETLGLRAIFGAEINLEIQDFVLKEKLFKNGL